MKQLHHKSIKMETDEPVGKAWNVMKTLLRPMVNNEVASCKALDMTFESDGGKTRKVSTQETNPWANDSFLEWMQTLPNFNK